MFLVIYDSTVKAGTGFGLYIKADVFEVNNVNKIDFAYSLITKKRNPIPYWQREKVQFNSPIRLYHAVPKKIWTNGNASINGQYVDKLIPIDINK